MQLDKAIDDLLNATRHAITERETAAAGTADIAFSDELYVWPEAGALHGIERTPLLDIMQGFLNNRDARVHVLVGDPGAGKTTFAKKWLAQCLPESDIIDVQSYIVDDKKTHLHRTEETNPASAYLPIFITLNQLLTRGKEYEAHFIYKNILERYFKTLRLDYTAIQTIKRTVHLLVFLDGYDEIGYEGNLFRDNHWNEWPHCKFVISTRPEKFGEQLERSEFQRALTRAFSTTGTSETDPKLTITTLRDFNDANIQAFIQQWVTKEHKSVNSAVVLETTEPELHQHPITLQINDTKNKSVEQGVLGPIFEGMEFQKIPPDGHCLFHAIGLYLGRDADSLRREISDHMETNFDEFKHYREETEEMFREYIETIRNGKEWGDHIEIEIIQRITDRPVIIIHSESNPTIPDNLENYNGDPIFIYYNDQDHYDAFVLREGTEARTVLAAIQEKLEQGQSVKYNPVTQFYDHSRISAQAESIQQPVPSQLQNIEVSPSKIDDTSNHPGTEAAPWDAERYWQAIESMPDLKELATNPVILRLILFALPTLHAKFAEQEEASRVHQTRLGVYQAFVNVWFQRQMGLVGHDKNILEQLRQHDDELFHILDNAAPDGLPEIIQVYLYRYTRNLAYQALLDGEDGKLKLELLNETTLNPGLLHDVRRADPIIASLLPDQQITLLKILRKGCLLRCDKDYFRFFHKSIIEYFTQAHIQASAVGLSDIILQNKVKAAGADDEVNAELNEQLKELSLNQRLIIHEANLRKFLVEQTQHDKSFEQVLVEMILLSKDYPDVSIAAANAITILNQANYPINALDLRGIRIPGADLSKAILHQADLTCAELNRVNFSKAYLDGANFSNASLKDCEWGMVNKIQFNNKVTACVFTQDGRWLIVGDNKGNIQRINTVSWAIEQTKNQTPRFGSAKIHSVRCLAAGYRFKTRTHTHIPALASSSRGGLIYLWTLPSLSDKQKLKGHTDFVNALAFHPTKALLASGSKDKTIRLWHSDTGKALKQLQGHTNFVNALAFHPTQALLASGSDDRTIRLWNSDTGEELKVLGGHTNTVTALAFHPTQALLASGSSDQSIRFWHSDTGEMIQQLQGHMSGVDALAFHSTQAILASSSDKTIRLWNGDTGEELKNFQNHTRSVAFVFHPTQTLLASWSNFTLDKNIHLLYYDMNEEFKRLLDYTDPVTSSLAFHPTKTLLASGSRDGTICFWNSDTGEELQRLQGHTRSISALAFHPTQTLLASGSGETIKLWNSDTGEELKRFRGHIHPVLALAFHPTRALLASSGYDKTISLWQSDTCEKLKLLQGHTESVNALAFHFTQELLTSASHKDTAIHFWNCDTGEERQQFQNHTDDVFALAFHPTQALLASGSRDKTIRLWNTEQGLCTQIITMQGYIINALLFKQDNTLKVGGIKEEGFEIFTMTPNTVTNTYRLTHLMYKRNLFFSAHGLNLTKTKGLSKQQHKFLTNQGAIGAPQHFAILAADVNIDEEKKQLKQLRKLLDTLKVGAPDARQETHSLLPGNKFLTVGLYRWQISIIRVTQSSGEIHRRHVYGLLEGLDALGRRVWIRLHLVAENENTRYAHIENLARIAASADISSAKKAFMALFREDSRTGIPHEIAYHVTGAINREEMIALVESMMNDQQRQYGPEENRIHYRFTGGNEASTQGAYNCLTWLRAHFSIYDLEMPRASLDGLIVNPAHVVNTQTFYKSRPNVHTLDLTDWQNDDSAPSPHPRPRQKPY